MPYAAVAIANEFIQLASGNPLSPMKLQKLVYFAHGWCLALTGQPLISERIEAWQWGPVIPALYQEFKGSGPITRPAAIIRFVSDTGKIVWSTPSLDDYPDDEQRREAREIIARVLQEYGGFSAIRLSNATHMAGTPWQQVYQEGRRHTIIPDEMIADYFRGLTTARG
jgi:uncharacterized phage-associated protein